MVEVNIGRLIADGYLVLSKNPWNSGKLKKYARMLGKSPSEAIAKRPPPWAWTREGPIEGASEAQMHAMIALGEVSQRTKGQPLPQRLMTIKRELKGKSYPGKTPRLSGAVLQQLKEAVMGKAPEIPEVLEVEV